MDSKQRLLQTTTLGLPRIRRVPRTSIGLDEAFALASAADKRARRAGRNLQQVAAGGWYAPPRQGMER